MKALGHGSFASIIKPVLDIAWYLLWALLAFASLVMVSSVIAYVMNFIGYTPGIVSDLFDTLRSKIIHFTLFSVELITLLVITDRLRKIFATLISGDPFVPENAGHLRVIAIAIGAYQIFRQATLGIIALAMTVIGQPIEGGASVELSSDIELGAWFAVATMLIFAEVFREGAKMRQEQKLTI